MDKEGDKGRRPRHERVSSSVLDGYAASEPGMDWNQLNMKQQAGCRQRSKSPRVHRHSERRTPRSDSPGEVDLHHHHRDRDGSAGRNHRRQRTKVTHRHGHTPSQGHHESGFRGSSPDIIELENGDVDSASSQEISGDSGHYVSTGHDPSPPNVHGGETCRQPSPVEALKCPKTVGELFKTELPPDASSGVPNPLPSSLPQGASLANLQAAAAFDASIYSSIQILQFYQQQQMLAAHCGLSGLGQAGLFSSLPLASHLTMPCANSLHAPLLPCSCVTCQSAMLSQDLSRYLPQLTPHGQLPPLVPPLPLPHPHGTVSPQNQDVQALLKLLQQNDGKDAHPGAPAAKTCHECACEAECYDPACNVPVDDPPPLSGATPPRASNAPPTHHHPTHQVHQAMSGSPIQQGTGYPPVAGATASMTPLRQALSSNLCSSPLQNLMSQLNESGLSSVSAIQFSSPDRHNASRGDENPPIGVFWDIENCAVPRGKSALAVVQRIRECFFSGHREAEFMCVCDINKENSVIIQELNDAQVTVAHINATAKNAADDKLRQSLRRFADTHSSPATVVLISGDINFARDLSDLRHRNGLKVILVHGQAASEALKTCANKAVRYDELLADLPFRSPVKGVTESTELIVYNLPSWKEPGIVRARLKQLSDNCGGKVGSVNNNNTAFIKFPSHEIATRAKKRLDGEKVYGNVIATSFGRSGRVGYGSPRYRNYQVRRDSESYHEYNHRVRQDDVSSHDSSSSQGMAEVQREEPRPPIAKRDTSSLGPAPKPIPVPVVEHRETCQSPLGGQTNMNVSSGLAAAFRPIQASAPPALPPQPFPPPPLYEGINVVMDGAAQKPYHAPQALNSNYNAPQTLNSNYNAPQAPNSNYNAPQSLNSNYNASQALNSNYNASTGRSEWKPLIPTPPPPPDCGYQSYGGDAFHHPVPSVQRVTGGPHLHLKKDGTPGNPYLKGSYRAPSPLMETSKLKPSWQQQQQQQQPQQQPHQQPQQQQPQGALLPTPGIKPWTPMPGIDLLVTNLDSQMTRKELKRHLVAAISEHCRVLHVFLAAPSQGYFQAVVRVPTMGDALGVLGNVNRRQIGSRLVHISIMPPGDSNADRLRMMIIQMLQEVPGMTMLLYKLKQAFENRYQQQLFVADLYQIPDTVSMQDGHGGKLVCLAALSASNSPAPGSYTSPLGWQSPAVPFLPPREPIPETCERYCTKHDPDGQSQYRLLDTDLCVLVAYQTFTAQVTTLLHMHSGGMSLISFPLCYNAEYTALDEDFEKGIPLEHLLNSVPGVRVAFCRDGFKVVCWSQHKEEIVTDDGQHICPPLLGRTTPLLPPPLFQFSKEVVELLKHSNKCRLPFTRFVPAYHHHFGRQVRVADYGYLKLIELFEAISHVLEILGATENKTLTLTHRAQVKRFGQDLIKVLKSQASKKVTIGDFAAAFQRCLGRQWDTVDYGVCDIQDLLFDLPENWVTIEWDGDSTVISIPKREQTDEERVRTKKFTREIVDLLCRQHRCRITFSKFIPAYHHHFGRQCRVGEYGFNKLAELLGAIPDVVQIEEYGDERSVRLTEPERLAVMARHISQLVPRNRQHSLALGALLPAYCKVFGHPVCLEDYGVHDLEALVIRFCHIVEIICEDEEKRLRSVERQHLSDLTQQVLVVLLGEVEEGIPVGQVEGSYRRVWGRELIATQYGFSCVTLLLKALHHVVTVRDEWSDSPVAELTPTYKFALGARRVLLTAPNQTLSLEAFISRYRAVQGCELHPHDYGQTTVSSLVSSVPRVMTLVGRGAKRAITLNPCCLAASEGAGAFHEQSSSDYKTSPSEFAPPSSTTSEKESEKSSSISTSAPSTTASEKESEKSSSSNSTSESDVVRSSPPSRSPSCDLLSEGAGPSRDSAPYLQPSKSPLPQPGPTDPSKPPPPPQPKDLITFESPSHTLPEGETAVDGQKRMEHIDLMSLIHLLPQQTRFSMVPPDQQHAPSSVPHSTSFTLDQGGDRGPDLAPRRQASSLPSSVVSSPRRDGVRGRPRFRLAANFSLGFQEG